MFCVVGLFAHAAVADKLCFQTTVKKRTLKVTNTRVVAAVCPKDYSELLDLRSFRGPKGPAGSFNAKAKCVARESSATGTGVVSTYVQCQSDEFIASNTCASIEADIMVTSWMMAPVSGISENLYSYLGCRGFRSYRFSEFYNSEFRITAQALCCKG